MQIFPAIDLSGGAVVRLTQGDYNRKQTYSDDPAAIARGFAQGGAKNLHVIDLDGAKDGALVNLAAVESIVKAAELFVQVGGGIRDEERIERYLGIGVGRVILGTVAAEDFAFLERMVAKYGERIAVSVDARDGLLAVRGWLETTALDSFAFCKKLCDAGVRTIIYTDISKDGAMSGTNIPAYRRLSAETGCDIVASGGISAAAELGVLDDMGIYGAIVGKALYNGAITLEEAMTWQS